MVEIEKCQEIVSWFFFYEIPWHFPSLGALLIGQTPIEKKLTVKILTCNWKCTVFYVIAQPCPFDLYASSFFIEYYSSWDSILDSIRGSFRVLWVISPRIFLCISPENPYTDPSIGFYGIASKISSKMSPGFLSGIPRGIPSDIAPRISSLFFFGIFNGSLRRFLLGFLSGFFPWFLHWSPPGLPWRFLQRFQQGFLQDLVKFFLKFSRKFLLGFFNWFLFGFHQGFLHWLLPEIQCCLAWFLPGFL